MNILLRGLFLYFLFVVVFRVAGYLLKLAMRRMSEAGQVNLDKQNRPGQDNRTNKKAFRKKEIIDAEFKEIK